MHSVGTARPTFHLAAESVVCAPGSWPPGQNRTASAQLGLSVPGAFSVLGNSGFTMASEAPSAVHFLALRDHVPSGGGRPSSTWDVKGGPALEPWTLTSDEVTQQVKVE